MTQVTMVEIARSMELYVEKSGAVQIVVNDNKRTAILTCKNMQPFGFNGIRLALSDIQRWYIDSDSKVAETYKNWRTCLHLRIWNLVRDEVQRD